MSRSKTREYFFVLLSDHYRVLQEESCQFELGTIINCLGGPPADALTFSELGRILFAQLCTSFSFPSILPPLYFFAGAWSKTRRWWPSGRIFIMEWESYPAMALVACLERLKKDRPGLAPDLSQTSGYSPRSKYNFVATAQPPGGIKEKSVSNVLALLARHCLHR